MNGWAAVVAHQGRCRLLLAGVFLAAFFILTADSPAKVERPYFTDRGQFNYARFLEREGDYGAAAREYARLIERFPSSGLLPDAQFNQGMDYLKAGRFREAREVLGLFLVNYPDSPFRGMAERGLEEAKRRYLDGRARNLRRPRVRAAHVPRMRAVQVPLFGGRTLSDVEGEIRAIKAAGIDTIIMRVFQNPGDRFYRTVKHKKPSGVYFSTSHAPVVEDLLGPIVAMAHSHGLRVFAWMTTRYADYGVERRSDIACRAYDIKDGEYYRCRGLDLFNDEAVRRLASIYSDLAAYDIDGILFQDDLFLRHNEGFGPSASRLFRRQTGLKLAPGSFYIEREDGGVDYTPLFWKWASWKNRRLMEVAARLMRAVRRKNPRVRFAVNLMYESLTNPPAALAWLSQSLESSVMAGFDYFSIMAYERQMSRELKKGRGQVRRMIEAMMADAARIVGEPERVLVKFQTVDWRSGAPLDEGEVLGLLGVVRGLRRVSVAFVPYREGLPLKGLLEQADGPPLLSRN